MILDTTSDTLEILLGANVAASQASFTCQFNEMSSTTFIPKSSHGQTNNTTAVTIISAPSSTFQRQLKFLNVENNDTAAITVTIRFNNSSVTRTIFKVTLQVGESLTYEVEKGWTVSDAFCSTEYGSTHVHTIGNIMMHDIFVLADYASASAALNVPRIVSLGRIYKGTSTSINFLYNIVTLGSTFQWAELAVYRRMAGSSCPGQSRRFERLGFVSTTGVWNTLGIKNTQVSISNFNIGDHLYVIFASNSSTNPIARGSVADQNNSTIASNGLTTTTTLNRPSTHYVMELNSFANPTVLFIYQIN